MSGSVNHLYIVASNAASALVSAPEAASSKLYAIRDFFADDCEALTVTQVPDTELVSIDDETPERLAASSIAARGVGIVATSEH